MSDLERYQPPADDPIHAWVALMRPAAELARGIHETDFVPKSLRGSVGAVTAAILTGEEWQVGPMTALSHIHVVEGRPTPSAHLQSAMVRRAGHDIEPIEGEQNATRCLLRCRRKGSDRWHTVGYTIHEAQQAGLAGKKNWREHPIDMLFARAVGRACRQLFSDVVMGMPYNAEEMRDGGIADDAIVVEDEPAAPAAVEPPKRTAQRRTAPKSRPAADAAPPPPADPTPPEGPPLPGEPGFDDDGGEVVAAGANKTEQNNRSGADGSPPRITAAQKKRYMAAFNHFSIADRDERLTITGQIVNRPVESSNELTRDEAGVVIDTLAHLATSKQDFGSWLAALFAANDPDLQPVEDQPLFDDEEKP